MSSFFYISIMKFPKSKPELFVAMVLFAFAIEFLVFQSWNLTTGNLLGGRVHHEKQGSFPLAIGGGCTINLFGDGKLVCIGAYHCGDPIEAYGSDTETACDPPICRVDAACLEAKNKAFANGNTFHYPPECPLRQINGIDSYGNCSATGLCATSYCRVTVNFSCVKEPPKTK